MSKFYLIHVFKELFHLTPIQYHQKVRLERAKNLIRHTPASLQEIAEQLGFANIHAFSRAFKSKEGMSPSQFRGAER
jgi:AraC-like DNA-binding protein